MATEGEVRKRLAHDLATVNKSRLARELEMTTAAGRRLLRKWEVGPTLPSPENAAKLARTLRKPADHYLVTRPSRQVEDLAGLRSEVAALAGTVARLSKLTTELGRRVRTLEQRPRQRQV